MRSREYETRIINYNFTLTESKSPHLSSKEDQKTAFSCLPFLRHLKLLLVIGKCKDDLLISFDLNVFFLCLKHFKYCVFEKYICIYCC